RATGGGAPCEPLVGTPARRAPPSFTRLRNPLAQLEGAGAERAQALPPPVPHPSARALREAPHLSSTASAGPMVQGQGHRHPCLHHSCPQELPPVAAQWRARRWAME